MLSDIPFKAVYRSETDNLLRDFYVPALRESSSYDRAVGFFSANMIAYAAQGLTAFVRNGGRIRLIFGAALDPADIEAIKNGYAERSIDAKLSDVFLAEMSRVSEQLFQTRLEVLSYLVANRVLEIKVALKQRGMYHEKIGILRDTQNNTVVFQGSANETAQGLLPEFNFESINVFPSWRPELRDHYAPYIEGFERLWENKSPNTLVLPFPTAAKEKLLDIAREGRLPTPDMEIDLWERLRNEYSIEPERVSVPQVPKQLGGNAFSLFSHQKKALAAWKASDAQGVLALATGAGKTITSLYAATRVFEAAGRLCVVVAVPYQNLGDQWYQDCRAFGMLPIRCYGAQHEWYSDFSRCAQLFKAGNLPFLCVIVVNRTLQSEAFQGLLGAMSGDSVLFIGDECHHHSSAAVHAALPQNARFRIGLSATPDHYLDPNKTDLVHDYYGPTVFSYGLADALRDGVLTPYLYYPHLVRLTEDEQEGYIKLTDDIGKLLAASASGGDWANEQIQILLFKRARLLGAAKNKLDVLVDTVKFSSPSPMTIFYCGDGSVEGEDAGDSIRQIDAVSKKLFQLGWKVSQFTARESLAERRDILDNFRLGLIDGLVAIRCLDEGIDIPACSTAYILASSRNPKQFIQRRGRILRRAPGKKRAIVHDFIVHASDIDSNEVSQIDRQLFGAELERVAEFAKLSLNYADSYTVLKPLLDRYDLTHRLT